MSETVSGGESPITPITTADGLLASKKYEEALVVARDHWLANKDDLAAVDLFARVMKAMGKRDLAQKLANLCKFADALTKDAQNLFEAGFKLIDERELELAIFLLERCVKLEADDPTINYELAFALMSVHKFKEAIPYFQSAAKADSKDYDSRLNLAVCYTMVREVDKAKEMVDQASPLTSSEEERKEIELRRHCLKRMQQLAGRKDKAWSARDWLYTLYGSVLLKQSSAAQQSPENPSYKDIAWILLVLQGVLTEIGLEFDVIEFYSPLSRPLAEALSQMMDLPVQGYKGMERRDRALLVMSWASNIIGPHESFIQNNGKVVIFAYGLSSTQPLPLTPDVVGTITAHCHMPWSESTEEEGEADVKEDLPDDEQAQAMEKILEQVHSLQSLPSIIQAVQEIATYYEKKQDLLVPCNPKVFPERAQYTAEILVQ